MKPLNKIVQNLHQLAPMAHIDQPSFHNGLNKDFNNNNNNSKSNKNKNSNKLKQMNNNSKLMKILMFQKKIILFKQQSKQIKRLLLLALKLSK